MDHVRLRLACRVNMAASAGHHSPSSLSAPMGGRAARLSFDPALPEEFSNFYLKLKGLSTSAMAGRPAKAGNDGARQRGDTVMLSSLTDEEMDCYRQPPRNPFFTAPETHSLPRLIRLLSARPRLIRPSS